MMEKTFFDAIKEDEILVNKCKQLNKSYNPKHNTIDIELALEIASKVIEVSGINFYKSRNKISFRKAAIVVVEETLINHACSRKELEISAIIKKTKVRFRTNLSNRIGLKYSHIEDIHPEDPCTYFDTTTEDDTLLLSNRAKKRQYKKALIDILHNKDWLISLKQAELNLSETLAVVKIC